MKILEIKDLSVKYKNFFALKNISFDIEKGDALGIAGQSGSGKTTLCKAIAQVEKATKGEIKFNTNENSPTIHIQYIFQDPASSLNPRMKIKDIVLEPLLLQKPKDKKNLDKLFTETILKVGLSYDLAHKYPHQLSGGQKQRVAIARAIITKPDLLICDEPISSLDISISAQILNLLKDLLKEYKFTLIFVSHDISSIYYLTNKVIILYKGEMLEWGDTQAVITKPAHPYTKLLISSILSTDKKNEKISIVEREVNSACVFSNICIEFSEACLKFDGKVSSAGKNHYYKCIEVSK
ncbi:MAG: ATP-binding cassette domain-containing protein [Elusimicrobiota bacterium]